MKLLFNSPRPLLFHTFQVFGQLVFHSVLLRAITWIMSHNFEKGGCNMIKEGLLWTERCDSSSPVKDLPIGLALWLCKGKGMPRSNGCLSLTWSKSKTAWCIWSYIRRGRGRGREGEGKEKGKRGLFLYFIIRKIWLLLWLILIKFGIPCSHTTCNNMSVRVFLERFLIRTN